MNVENLINKAQTGDKTALEGVVSSIQDNVYYLALRMLVNPEDARDATQEILVKVITNLATFKFESQFNTWVYRIATNHLLTEKNLQAKELNLTFELYRQDLESDLQEPTAWKDDPQYTLLLNELRISCTMAMLLCLNPSQRLAYILGDIFELDHNEASTALSITKDNFRKLLSRARAAVHQFTQESCGLVNNCAKCSCEKKITGAITRQRISPSNTFFASGSEYSYETIKQTLSQTQQDLKTLAQQQSVTRYKCPIKFGEQIVAIVADGINTREIMHNNKLAPY